DAARAAHRQEGRDLSPRHLGRDRAVARTQRPGRKHVGGRTRKGYPGGQPHPKNIASDDVGTLIEFRRDGLIGLIPCQHSAGRYEYETGTTVACAPLLSDDDSDLLVEAARALNERIVVKSHEAKLPDDTARPGDDFNRRTTDLAPILEPHGWEIEKEREGVRYWRRPG